MLLQLSYQDKTDEKLKKNSFHEKLATFNFYLKLVKIIFKLPETMRARLGTAGV